jgi:hypothetical protein
VVFGPYLVNMARLTRALASRLVLVQRMLRSFAGAGTVDVGSDAWTTLLLALDTDVAGTCAAHEVHQAHSTLTLEREQDAVRGTAPSPRQAALAVLRAPLFRQLTPAAQAALVARLCLLMRQCGQVGGAHVAVGLV